MTRLFAALSLALLVSGSSALAQPGAGPSARGAYLGRDDLRALLDRLERAARSPAYSEALHARARGDAAVIRSRLNDGDFQVGDRILLAVQGESTLSDTFTVAAGNTLQLRAVGQVPLRGVLHAELESYLAERLTKFIRDPKVWARSLLRISVAGGVIRPGFYSVPSEALLADALMAAGGPTATARVNELQVEREGRPLWSGRALRDAIEQGRTLDQLNIRAGDRLFVPTQSPMRTVTTLLGTAPMVLFWVTRLF